MERVTIVRYERRWRDDMIYMILAAKDALGRVPTLNEDLLDIDANYLARGDGFFLALSPEGRVLGSLGWSSIPGTEDVWLHRFYVHPAHWRQGVGTALFRHVERQLRGLGKAAARVHLGGRGYEGSQAFYLRLGFCYEDEEHMRKDLR